MTTDTAVRVTRTVIQQKGKRPAVERMPPTQLTRYPVKLADIPYIDNPELRIDEHESTEMPFRYVKNADGLPVMPEVGNPKFHLTVFVLGVEESHEYHVGTTADPENRA